MLAASFRDGDEMAPQAFLVGLCSLLDAILERSMADILEGFPITGDAKAALLGGENRLRTLLDCAIAYERGHWQRAVDHATQLRLDPARLPAAYEDALKWSREFEKQRA
jgi:EAL and modified HD-GYP domain-containing signal transduction protein